MENRKRVANWHGGKVHVAGADWTGTTLCGLEIDVPFSKEHKMTELFGQAIDCKKCLKLMTIYNLNEAK